MTNEFDNWQEIINPKSDEEDYYSPSSTSSYDLFDKFHMGVIIFFGVTFLSLLVLVIVEAVKRFT